MSHPLANRLGALWGQLAPRERQLLLAGGALLGLALLYTLVWQPLHKEVARLRVDTPKAAAQLARMREQAALIQPLRGRVATAPASGNLVQAVEQSATGRGLRKQISRLEADGSNGVQVTAEAISFNSLVAWLADLRDNQALVVDNLVLDAHNQPGAVNARIRLRIEKP